VGRFVVVVVDFVIVVVRSDFVTVIVVVVAVFNVVDSGVVETGSCVVSSEVEQLGVLALNGNILKEVSHNIKKPKNIINFLQTFIYLIIIFNCTKITKKYT